MEVARKAKKDLPGGDIAMDNRTEDLVRRYVAGDLDEEQCNFVEQLASQDHEVERAIDDGLKPVARAFRDAFPSVPNKAASIDASMRHQRRAARWIAPLSLAAVASALAIVFWPRSPEIILVSSSGSVVTQGRTLEPGDAIPVGELVFTIGQAEFQLDGTSISSDPTVGCIRFELDGSTYEIVDEAGSLSFLDSRGSGPYRVAYADRVATPLGTRFAVSAPSILWSGLSVFMDRVEVSKNGLRRVVPEGRADWLSPDREPVIEDDLAAIPVGGTMKVPTRSGLVDRKRLAPPAMPQELQSELTKIAADQNGSDASKFWRMSLELARFEEPESSSHFATAALSSGVRLSEATDAELWTLIRCHARKTGDGHLASLLIDELDRRTSNGDLVPYRALVAAWTGHGTTVGQARLAAAVALAKLKHPSDELLIAEGLIFGYQEFQAEKAHLEQAKTLLLRLVDDPSRMTRTRAVACQRMGEAVYFLGPKRESIPWTLRAIGLWPRARWKVHAGTRMTECNAAQLDVALTWIEQGLVEEPSYYSYERACVALYAGATRVSDYNVLRSLCNYVANTYRSVPDAQAHMAQWIGLDWEDVSTAEPMMNRAVDLWGSELLPFGYKNDWGSILVRAGREKEGRSFALEGKAEDDVSLSGFYRRIEDWPRALASIENTPIEEQNANYHLDHGLILKKLGRNREALAEVQLYLSANNEHIKSYGRPIDVGGFAHALVICAETTSVKSEALKYAKSVLDVLATQDEMSKTGMAARALLEARARFILGQADQAIKITQDYLTKPIIPEQRREAEELLARFQGR